MPDFSKRSYQKELLDAENVPFSDIKRNMQELDTINSLLGGHTINKKAILQLLQQQLNSGATIHICEIGCGDGNNLRNIMQWFSNQQINVRLTGVDINAYCIAYAQTKDENKGIDFICSDYATVTFQTKPDIIFSSLFCHHFTDEELTQQFIWMKANSAVGFFVNDLHRHAIAYHSIKMLSSLFSKSYLVKNDAPLSVLRGFKRNELKKLMQQAQPFHYQLHWKWAFRWLLIVIHEQPNI